MMITLFGFAEIERDLIAERTKEGLAAARAQGRLLALKGSLGTSKLTGREAEIQSLLAKTVSKRVDRENSRGLPSTLHTFIQSRRLAWMEERRGAVMHHTDEVQQSLEEVQGLLAHLETASWVEEDWEFCSGSCGRMRGC